MSCFHTVHFWFNAWSLALSTHYAVVSAIHSSCSASVCAHASYYATFFFDCKFCLQISLLTQSATTYTNNFLRTFWHLFVKCDTLCWYITLHIAYNWNKMSIFQWLVCSEHIASIPDWSIIKSNRVVESSFERQEAGSCQSTGNAQLISSLFL